MRYDNKTLFELNCIGFEHYLKLNSSPKSVSVGTPIKDELSEQIGREPTIQEFEKYIELVVMPTRDPKLHMKRKESLIKLIFKNAKEKETRKFSDSNQF